MKTLKQIEVPIFNIPLDICIYDSRQDVLDYMSNYDDSVNEIIASSLSCKGFTIYNKRCLMVFIHSDSGVSTIAHESLHIKNCIFKAIGQECSVDNDEIDSYLVGYIAKEITDIYWKHKGYEKELKFTKNQKNGK